MGRVLFWGDSGFWAGSLCGVIWVPGPGFWSGLGFGAGFVAGVIWVSGGRFCFWGDVGFWCWVSGAFFFLLCGFWLQVLFVGSFGCLGQVLLAKGAHQ